MDDAAWRISSPLTSLTTASAGQGPVPLCPADILRHLARMLAAPNIELVWAEAVAAFRALGLAQVIYGYSPDARGALLGSADDFLVLSTLRREQIGALVANGFHFQSVTFNWAMRNVGVASWSLPLRQANLPPGFAQRPEALAFFAEVELHAGLSIGFAMSRTRGAAAMSLAAPPGVTQEMVDAWLPGARTVLFVLGSVAHRALSGLPWTRASGDLTPRQREVLEWVAEGKTMADIAVILNLQPATVEKHLRLARQVLGVETTAHALIKAAFRNQLYASGPGRPGATGSGFPD